MTHTYTSTRVKPLLLAFHGYRGSGKDTAIGMIETWAAMQGYSLRKRGFADLLKWSVARLFIPDITMDDALRWINAWKDEDAEQEKQTGSWAGFSRKRVMVGIPSQNAGGMFSPEWTVAKWDHILSIRELLQRYGTEAHRDVFGSNFWVDALLPMPLAVHDDASRHPVTTKWHESFVADDHLTADICCINDLRFENEAKRVKDVGGTIIKVEAGDRLERTDGHASEVPLDDKWIDYILDSTGSLEDLATSVAEMMNADRPWLSK